MIQIPESIRDHWIFHNPFYFRQWFAMLMIAAKSDGYTYIGRRKVIYRRGEIAMSMRMLAKELGINKNVLIDMMRIFAEENIVSIKKGPKYSIIRFQDFNMYASEKDCTVKPYNKQYNPQDNEQYNVQDNKQYNEQDDKQYNAQDNNGDTPYLYNKDIDYINNNFNHHHRARSRVREEKIKNGDKNEAVEEQETVQLSCNKKFLGMVAENFKISEKRAAQLARTFSEEIAARGKTHSNSEDEKMHFVYWLKKVLNVETNGFTRKNNEKEGSSGVQLTGSAGSVTRYRQSKRAVEPEYGLIEE